MTFLPYLAYLVAAALICAWFRDLGFAAGLKHASKEAEKTYSQGYNDGIAVAKTLGPKLQEIRPGHRREWP